MSLNTLISSVQEEADRRTPEIIAAILTHKPRRRTFAYFDHYYQDRCDWIHEREILSYWLGRMTKTLDPNTFDPIYTYDDHRQKDVVVLVMRLQDYLRGQDGCGKCQGCLDRAKRIGPMSSDQEITSAVISYNEMAVKKKNPPPPGSSGTGTTRSGGGGQGATNGYWDDRWSSHDGDSDFEWPRLDNPYIPERKPGLTAIMCDP